MFRTGWAASVQAVLWPVGMLLIASVALSIPSYGLDEDDVVSGTDRFRIVLALLLQGLGGGFEVSGPGSRYGGGDDLFGSGDGGFGDGGAFGRGGARSEIFSLSVAPLTLTVLWIVAVLIGARLLRTRQALAPAPSRTAGLEAAVRIALLASAAVLVLALIAQPTIEGVEFSSLPFLAVLGTLALTLATAGAVLHRDDLAQWLAARPGAQRLVRVTATALRALAVVLALAAATGYAWLASLDDMGKEGLLVLVAFLPNIGAAALGLGWGGALELTARGSSGFGSRTETEKLDLSELADLTGDWVMAVGLGLGAVCALTVAVTAARRHPNRGEQALAAGLFFGLLLLVCALSALGVDGRSGGIVGLGGAGAAEAALDIPEMLLFGLLWLSAATFLGPYVQRMLGTNTMPPAPYASTAAPGLSAPTTATGPYAPTPAPGPYAPTPPPGPYAPQQGPGADTAPAPLPADPSPTGERPQAPTAPPEPVYDLGTVGQPETLASGPAAPPAERSRVTLWIVTLTAALALGGGAAAGFLLLQDEGREPGGDGDAKPTASASPGRSEHESPGASGSEPPGPERSTAPTAEDSESPATQADIRIVTDPAGFSFAIPKLWSRAGEENGQVTYAGSTGFAHFLVGVVPDAEVSSYENFRKIEERSRQKTDYRRIRLEENTFRGQPGAIWEYTYTEEQTGRTVHAIDQGYVAEDGTEYAIYYTDYEDGWELSGQDFFDKALATWRVID
ncbi:hypothetical protein [Streptomyces sp. KLOTTS4A1]|uniref:hypothetical protein n=1 Tax=Streptomyces sp. KLOTTS4A1 TaxID=3390996 RepID=UPI0039F49D51